MNLGNAFLRHQGGMFITCEGCTTYQECGTRGTCYRDMCASYNGQYNVPQNIAIGWAQGLPSSLFCNFRRDYDMLREADSDGGECD